MPSNYLCPENRYKSDDLIPHVDEPANSVNVSCEICNIYVALLLDLIFSVFTRVLSIVFAIKIVHLCFHAFLLSVYPLLPILSNLSFLLVSLFCFVCMSMCIYFVCIDVCFCTLIIVVVCFRSLVVIEMKRLTKK